jgi:hypothetical protein
MDFRVYYYGGRGVFDGTKPMYGRTSGLGWPMHYRYPPLFLLLFAPLAFLPLGLAAAIWLLLKIVVLIAMLSFIARRMRSDSYRTVHNWWIIPVLLAGTYVVQDFRYGNAQFFIFALTTVGLLLVEENALLAAAALALGIAIKVWPLFFVPVLIAQRYIKVAAYTLLFVVVLTLIPSFHFGLAGNRNLLNQWFHQEYSTQTGQEEIWFPSQSLRGMMMRYLTRVDYSQVPDSNYTNVNIAAIDPKMIRAAWLILDVTVYLVFLGAVSARRGRKDWLEAALGFCLIALLQPFSQKYALVVLLFPAIIVANSTNFRLGRVRIPVFASIVLAMIQPVIPGSAAQRTMQVMGLDFAATLMLAVGLTSLFASGLWNTDTRDIAVRGRRR